jgi:hypothetical protein
MLGEPTTPLFSINDFISLEPYDYGKFAPRQRNALRLIFCNPEVRAAQPDWEAAASFVVAAFRAEAARAGAAERVKDLVEKRSEIRPHRGAAAITVSWHDAAASTALERMTWT